MSNWELAWIVVGAVAYLILGRYICLVYLWDNRPENPVLRTLLTLGVMVLWLPVGILLALYGMLFIS